MSKEIFNLINKKKSNMEENGLIKLKTLGVGSKFLLTNQKRTLAEHYYVLRSSEGAVEYYREFDGSLYYDNGEMYVMPINFKSKTIKK